MVWWMNQTKVLPVENILSNLVLENYFGRFIWARPIEKFFVGHSQPLSAGLFSRSLSQRRLRTRRQFSRCHKTHHSKNKPVWAGPLACQKMFPVVHKTDSLKLSGTLFLSLKQHLAYVDNCCFCNNLTLYSVLNFVCWYICKYIFFIQIFSKNSRYM